MRRNCGSKNGTCITCTFHVDETRGGVPNNVQICSNYAMAELKYFYLLKFYKIRVFRTYPSPVGRTLLPSKALIALDFPLLVRPKNATFTPLRAIISRTIATLDR